VFLVGYIINRIDRLGIRLAVHNETNDSAPKTNRLYRVEGSVKSNIAPFGADQVKYNGQKVVLQYFNWLYWVINFGSFCSLSGLAYVQQNGSFFVGFLIPFFTLILAFMLFFTGQCV
jgi:hypothetical protein